jgi:dipeptide/tripeptide permease
MFANKACIRADTFNDSIYTIGVAVLLITSIPTITYTGGLPGLLVALITISAALGGTKASLPPLLGKSFQYLRLT